MIIRDESHSDIRVVHADTWRSDRVFVASDKLGYSFHKTTMKAGTTTYMHYQNHYEVVYCINGTGDIEDVASGEKYLIEPGVCYVLNQHEQHRLTAVTDLVVLCVFTPPIIGNETHNKDGSYGL